MRKYMKKSDRIKSLVDGEQIHNALNILIPQSIQNENVVYLCIGTDRSTGDSLAPFVGKYLTDLGYENVYGTIDNPTHGENLYEVLRSIPKDKIVIAIDACLGMISSVGTIQIMEGSIKPGAGVGKKSLPDCGDYGIIGIVNVGGFAEYVVLQNTRLSVVTKMAKQIAYGITERFPLKTESTLSLFDENSFKQIEDSKYEMALG